MKNKNKEENQKNPKIFEKNPNGFQMYYFNHRNFFAISRILWSFAKVSTREIVLVR